MEEILHQLRTDIGLLVEGKAKELCPVRTGRLRASINSRVSGKDVMVGTNVIYAPHVEFGTSRQRAKPYLRPALFHSKDRIIELIKERLKT